MAAQTGHVTVYLVTSVNYLGRQKIIAAYKKGMPATMHYADLVRANPEIDYSVTDVRVYDTYDIESHTPEDFRE